VALILQHKWKALGLYVGVSVGTAVALKLRQAPATVASSHSTGAGATGGRYCAFDGLAASYDSEIGWDEIMMGLPLARRAICRHARGRVLEVSCGTGRNLEYLAASSEVEDVVCTDVSRPMLDVASQKAKEAGVLQRKRVVFRTMDAQELAFRDAQFDTVVDSFGLCSCDDPVGALKEMARVCVPAEQGGRILLLEHGRSTYDWLSRLLDGSAAKHAEKWGCWYNRDIEKLVADAGLQVETYRRFHFGTTHYIVASPPRAQEPSGAREHDAAA